MWPPVTRTGAWGKKKGDSCDVTYGWPLISIVYILDFINFVPMNIVHILGKTADFSVVVNFSFYVYINFENRLDLVRWNF